MGFLASVFYYNRLNNKIKHTRVSYILNWFIKMEYKVCACLRACLHVCFC